jgi:hypothetical protein
MWPGDTCHSTNSADEISLAEVPEGKCSIRRSRSIKGGVYCITEFFFLLYIYEPCVGHHISLTSRKCRLCSTIGKAEILLSSYGLNLDKAVEAFAAITTSH